MKYSTKFTKYKYKKKKERDLVDIRRNHFQK